jgi:hypothetical protein
VSGRPPRYNAGMTRPRDFIEVLENPEARPLQIADTGGALLLHLIVHIFFADEHLDDREVTLLSELVGEPSDQTLRDRITELGKLEMSYDKLAAEFPDERDRRDIITIAEHAWWADNMIEPGEMDVADKLAEHFGIDEL